MELLDINDVLGSEDTLLLTSKIRKEYDLNGTWNRYYKRIIYISKNGKYLPLIISMYITIRSIISKGSIIVYECSLDWSNDYDRSVIRTFTSLLSILQSKCEKEVTLLYNNQDVGSRFYVKMSKTNPKLNHVQSLMKVGTKRLVKIHFSHLSRCGDLNRYSSSIFIIE